MSCIPAAYGRKRFDVARTCDTGLVNGDEPSDTTWYWDLERKVAVPASERGAGDHVLGPYPTRHDAENWKTKVEERNEGWDDADQAWQQTSTPDDH